jgi:hypothetical protein
MRRCRTIPAVRWSSCDRATPSPTPPYVGASAHCVAPSLLQCFGEPHRQPISFPFYCLNGSSPSSLFSTSSPWPSPVSVPLSSPEHCSTPVSPALLRCRTTPVHCHPCKHARQVHHMSMRPMVKTAWWSEHHQPTVPCHMLIALAAVLVGRPSYTWLA